MRGFSPRILKYMRTLAEAQPGEGFVQQPVAQLPWVWASRCIELRCARILPDVSFYQSQPASELSFNDRRVEFESGSKSVYSLA